MVISYVDNIYSDDIIFMIYYILLSHHGNARMVTWIEPVDNIHSDDRNDIFWLCHKIQNPILMGL